MTAMSNSKTKPKKEHAQTKSLKVKKLWEKEGMKENKMGPS
jgi:hypothetical protein